MVRARGVDAVRRRNLARLLRSVHLHGEATRSELTAGLGLSRSTVGSLLGELIERGLVREAAPRRTGTRGRPSTLVQPEQGGVVVLAIEVNVDSLAAALVTVGGAHLGHVRRDRDHPGDDDVDPHALVAEVGDLTAPLLDALRSDQRLVGCGVSVAGVVRRDDGVVRVAPNLGWHDIPLADLLRDRLGLTTAVGIAVGNDADLGALAEHVRGAGVGVGDLVYLSGEVGVGSGVVVDGRPLRGVSGYAGEVGHVVVDPAGVPCHCGSVGCWETEIGEKALLDWAGRTGSGRRAVDEVVAAARDGDERAAAALERVGARLGRGLGGLVNIFNPRRIVLGGMFARIHDGIAPSLDATLRSTALAPALRDVEVVPAVLGIESPLVGAAEMALLPVLDDPTVVGRLEVAG